MINVGQDLIVGVGVNGGHQAVHDADFFMQHFRHRREAVGGARRIGDHGVAGFQRFVIHTVNDRCVYILAAGRGDDDLFRAAANVRGCFFFGREQPGAFQHDVNIVGAPGNFRRIAHGVDLDLVAVHHHVIAIDRDRALERAVCRVVARQMRVGFGIAEIVDRDDLNFTSALAFIQRAQNIAADAAITVDCYFNCHCFLQILLMNNGLCGLDHIVDREAKKFE